MLLTNRNYIHKCFVFTILIILANNMLAQNFNSIKEEIIQNRRKRAMNVLNSLDFINTEKMLFTLNDSIYFVIANTKPYQEFRIILDSSESIIQFRDISLDKLAIPRKLKKWYKIRLEKAEPLFSQNRYNIFVYKDDRVFHHENLLYILIYDSNTNSILSERNSSILDPEGGLGRIDLNLCAYIIHRLTNDSF